MSLFNSLWTSGLLRNRSFVWDAIPEIPELQCAWQLLLQCAVPRVNHLSWTLPSSQSARYALAHDWRAPRQRKRRQDGEGAGHPRDLDGLGLRSAEGTAPAAHWASWVDALSVLEARVPCVAHAATTALSAAQAGDNPQSATEEARVAGDLLAREGFVQKPS
jgi:hypothetical protein